MAKKKTKPSLKKQFKEVFHAAGESFKAKWKKAWDTYKTVIGPFVKGTFVYIYTLLYSVSMYVGEILYKCGKILYTALMAWVKRI